MERQNEMRQYHGAPSLIYSRPLAFWAQDWANHLAAEGFYYFSASFFFA